MQTCEQSTVFQGETQLIEAARAGDGSALVEYFFVKVLPGRAVRLVNGFRDAYGARLDAEDVLMAGVERVLRDLHKALAAANPIAWLSRAAQFEMLHFCQETRSAIRVGHVSQWRGHKVPQVASMDAPLSGADDLTLLDVIGAC